MKHDSKDFWMTLMVTLGGGYASIKHPEIREFVHPIVGAFVGSWLRFLPSPNGNGNGANAK